MYAVWLRYEGILLCQQGYGNEIANKTHRPILWDEILHFYSFNGYYYYYCNGFDQRIARQRLGKQVPTRNNGNCVSVDECYSSLLGSSQCANELAG
jgi:hypothetical protein